MVFVLAFVVLLTAWRFALTARRRGLFWAARDVLVAAISGWVAGVLIGIGARVAMGAITIANGDTQRFTWSGTVTVVVTFSGFGIIFGFVYEGLFRRLLRRSGVAFGLLITLCSWYPLTHAATQQLTIRPSVGSLVLMSGILVAAMWIPYAVLLELLLSRWRHGTAAPVIASPAV